MSDLKALKIVATRNGWEVKTRRAGHLAWVSPDKSQPLIFSPSTPGGGRAIANLKSQLRAAGLPV